MSKAKAILKDRFRILGVVAEGTYGIIYKAEDLKNQCFVAVKEIDLSGLSFEEVEETRSIMQAEIDYLKELEHNNLVRYISSFYIDGKFYYVTEWIEGITLRQALERLGRPFRGKDVLTLFNALSNFINYIHSQEMPYYLRLLRPSDIIIDENGVAKIVDLGTAMEIRPDHYPPGYEIPYEEPDERRDIFIIGSLLYELVTGIKLTEYGTVHFAPPKELNKEVSKALSDIITKSIVGRDRRYANVRTLKLDIMRWFPEYTDKSLTSQHKNEKEETAEQKEMSLKLSGYSMVGCFVIFIGLIIWAALNLPGIIENFKIEKMDECAKNITRLSKAIKRYKTDKGKYPTRLEDLVPSFIREIPTCPVAKSAVPYLKSYTYNQATNVFTLYCKGEYHKGVSAKDYPRYRRGKVIKKPKN